ncbi:LysE family translocator [Vibrio splendidus]|uniref:Lysine transporter LysE n=1 Tax=Vibrio splendidus TaxID=29497 RepID=A0A2N7JSD7_VIBSP|nr:LysE family transporter [Vibrio splendidus]PMM58044.1 lysine transporter LysE [Vibrio splendidus]
MDADLVGIFVTVAIAHFLALLSPGPDFVIVVKSAVRNKGTKALGVAFGIASANAVYIALCLVGVGSILAASVSVMIALKIVGGLFIVYLAVQAIRAKKCNYNNIDVVPENASSQTTFLKEFITGFLSGALNPKNLLFYLSLFTVVLNNDVSFMFKLGLGVWMTVVVFVWGAAIIFLLSAPKVRREFTRVAYYIDKVTGVMLGLLGLTIVKSALVRQ